MAEQMQWSVKNIAIGAAIVFAVSIVLFLLAGALNLPVPQWLISGLGGALGVAIWFAVARRMGGTK
jgi:hypothetical protein